ncbi:MAG TPA: hypothetical protein VD932_01070 [Aquabacterium sp.]|nr:hypothetical protein [Aquabacterium sp.]
MSTSADLAAAIVHAQQIGASHLVPLLRMVRTGAVNVAFVTRGTPAPMGRLKRSNRPAIALLGDDDAAPTGPAGWPQAERLVKWCGAAVVHSTGAKAEHYAAATALALAHRRLLLVETNTAMEPAWLALIQRLRPGLPGLIVRVRPGEPAHPMPSAPAGATIQ